MVVLPHPKQRPLRYARHFFAFNFSEELCLGRLVDARTKKPAKQTCNYQDLGHPLGVALSLCLFDEMRVGKIIL